MGGSIPNLSGFDAGLPANIDAEKTILGAILLDNAAHGEAANTIDAADFALDSHRRIFLRMTDLMNTRRAVDIVTLHEELARHKEVDTVGGRAYLASLTEGLPRRPVIGEYIKIIKDKSLLRRLMRICSAAIARATDQSETAHEVIGAAVAQLQESTAGREGSGLKLHGLGDLLSRPVVPVDWVVKGRLVAGSLSIWTAKPKVGKSTLARNLSLAASRGEPFLGWETKQGPVVYLNLEERIEDVASDFRMMGADGSEPIQISEAGTVNEVLALLLKAKPVLLVVDPLFRLVRVKDEKAYAEVYAHLGPLIDVARQTGTHILCLHHSSKQAKEDAIDSPLGSTALGGAVSTLFEMRRSETGMRTLRSVQRIGEPLEETVLEFDPARKSLRLGGTREDAEVGELRRRVLGAMGASEMLEREIDNAIEGRTGYKRRAIRELVQEGRLLRTGSGRRGDPFLYRKASAVFGGGA